MLELIAMLGKGAAASAAANAMNSPLMKLGEGIAAGNIGAGIGNAAQAAFGPQMEFGKAMMDPNANGFDAFMKMRQQMDDQPKRQPLMQMTTLSPMQTGPVGVPNQQQTRMPMAQGLPQGLFSQLGYRR